MLKIGSVTATVFLCAILFGTLVVMPQVLAAPPAGNGVWLSSTNAPPDIAAMINPREGTCADFVSQDRIYVSHGYGFKGGVFVGDNNALDAYDIDSDTWISLADAPTSRSEGAGASHGGLLYCIGGRSGTVLGTNEVYDPTTDTWATLSSMPTARAGLGVVAVGDKIFAVGGRTGTTPNSGVPLATLEAYDIATDAWSTLTSMSTPRGDVAVAEHGNKIYVAGGWNTALCPPVGMCSTVEVYDVASDTWATLPPMPTARSNAAAAVAGNTLFVIGGAISLVNTGVNEAFDINKATWGTATAKTTPCSETEGVTHGDRIYIAGCGIFGAASGVHEALLVNTYRRGF